MKKLVIVIASVLLLLSSCKKEEPETLIGNWELNKVTSIVNAQDELVGALLSKVISDSINNYKPDKFFITFNEDKTFTSVATIEGRQNEPVNGTYDVSGDKITLKFPDYHAEMTYALSKKKLSLQQTIPLNDVSGLLNILQQFMDGEKIDDDFAAMIAMIVQTVQGINSIGFTFEFDKK